MYRSVVAVLISCLLMTITFRQYIGMPGHQSDAQRTIRELVILWLPEESLHHGSRELAHITGGSSVLVVAVSLFEVLVF